MVSHPGRTSDPRRIRRLKSPSTLIVEENDEGLPARVLHHGRWQDIELVRSPWLVDQYWWRADRISRYYYRVTPNDGAAFTIYHDLVGDTWARQEYK